MSAKLETYPNDPETWALLGRVDKDAWIAAWRQPGKTPQQMQEEAAYEDVLLRATIDSYAGSMCRARWTNFNFFFTSIGGAVTVTEKFHVPQFMKKDIGGRQTD